MFAALLLLYYSVPALANITTVLVAKIVTSNNTAEFYCSATGKPVPTIQWLRYGALFDNSVRL